MASVVEIEFELKITLDIFLFTSFLYFQKHIITWDQLLEIGMDLPEHKLFERLRRVAINQCCSILYTSGTDSGPVKGVMLSHDNLTWSSKMVFIIDTYMSQFYLPYIYGYLKTSPS